MPGRIASRISVGCRCWTALALLVLLATAVLGQEDAFVPPKKNMPLLFTGASGSFSVSTRAYPTRVNVHGRIVYTILATCRGTVHQAPERPDLRKHESFMNRFAIEDLASQDLVSVFPGGQAWEWHYVLKPLGTSVDKIPIFMFDYYNNGRYQKAYSTRIPIEVGVREVVDPESIFEPAPPPPARVRIFAAEDRALGQAAPFVLPSFAVLVTAFGLPPVACIGMLWLHRRVFPRTLRRRHGRVAREALRKLRRNGAADLSRSAEHAASIVLRYLRIRVPIRGAAPTPMEIAQSIRKAGFSPIVAGRVEEFFRDCDTARFAPQAGMSRDRLVTEAEKNIDTLEAEWWGS